MIIKTIATYNSAMAFGSSAQHASAELHYGCLKLYLGTPQQPKLVGTIKRKDVTPSLINRIKEFNGSYDLPQIIKDELSWI